MTKACCAALTTVEAIAFACGTLPAWPMMTMKRPPPCAAHVRRDAARKLPGADHLGRGNAAAASSLATSSMRPARCVPALLTTMSMRPNALTISLDQRGDVGRLADVGDEALARRRTSARRPRASSLAASRPQIAMLQPSSREPLRDGEADAAGAAGDQRHLAGKSEIHAQPHPNT